MAGQADICLIGWGGKLCDFALWCCSHTRARFPKLFVLALPSMLSVCGRSSLLHWGCRRGNIRPSHAQVQSYSPSTITRTLSSGVSFTVDQFTSTPNCPDHACVWAYGASTSSFRSRNLWGPLARDLVMMHQCLCLHVCL